MAIHIGTIGIVTIVGTIGVGTTATGMMPTITILGTRGTILGLTMVGTTLGAGTLGTTLGITITVRGAGTRHVIHTAMDTNGTQIQIRQLACVQRIMRHATMAAAFATIQHRAVSVQVEGVETQAQIMPPPQYHAVRRTRHGLQRSQVVQM